MQVYVFILLIFFPSITIYSIILILLTEIESKIN